ncbi:hypothetical protein DFH06DRAFT_1174958 [Mycena polygramma]|nr:hypothetical protein DFH06DRAFT_1174958 [Mycena polygramma]
MFSNALLVMSALSMFRPLSSHLPPCSNSRKFSVLRNFWPTEVQRPSPMTSIVNPTGSGILLCILAHDCSNQLTVFVIMCE